MWPRSKMGRARVGDGVTVEAAAAAVGKTLWGYRCIELGRVAATPKQRATLERFFNRADIFDAEGYAVRDGAR